MIEILWSMGIQSCLLILFVLLIRAVFQKYPKIYSCGLWLLVLLRLLCPVFIESSLSLQPDLRNNALTQDTIQQPELLSPQNLNLPETKKGNSNPHTVSQQNPSSPLAHYGITFRSLYFILKIVYLAGAFVTAGIFMLQYLRIKKCVASAIREKENIFLCEHISSPFVMGIARPKIYLPYHIPEEEKQYILEHEYVHIRHKDILVRFLGIIACCMHWWNPLVWYAVHKMNQDMEMFCDETVMAHASLQERKSYSAALLHFSMMQSGLSATLSFGETNTEKRVKNVLKKKSKSILVLGIIMLAAAGAVVAFLSVPPKAAKTENTSETESKQAHTYTVNTEPVSTENSSVVLYEYDFDYVPNDLINESTQSPHTYETSYEMVTYFSTAEVEAFAREIRNQILNHDWAGLSEKTAFPVTIAGSTYENADKLLAADLDSIVTDDFIRKIRDESCENMSFNLNGIMMGETGQVWFTEVLDDNYKSQGLKIIAINI